VIPRVPQRPRWRFAADAAALYDATGTKVVPEVRERASPSGMSAVDFFKVRTERVTTYKSHGIEHYHKAVLVLLDRRGGSFKLDGSKSIQREFCKLIEPLLKDEDYQPFKSTLTEERWKTRFRWALKHMRQDGRLKHFELVHEYQITDGGRSYLETTALPMELLTEEVEFLDNGEVSVRYVRPDGTVDFEFRGSSDHSDDFFV
jgi:hypothetical protein